MELKQLKGKLPSIKRFFDADPTLQSVQIPITYDDKRLVCYRNKYCKKPECVYDQIQVIRRLKGQQGGTRVVIEIGDDKTFWCNICRNTIDPKEFLHDEELQRIIDNVWGQVDELAKIPGAKVDCKRAIIFRDGTWEPVFTQNVRGRVMRRTTTAINKALVLPSLEDWNEKEFQELYQTYLSETAPKNSKFDELVSFSLYPHPIRPDQGKREVTAYFKLSIVQALVKQFKLQVIHGPTFRMKVGKDLMRTFVKYLENQGLTTKKTGRKYYIIGFEAMSNTEAKSKVEKYKYYFFDKEELIEEYRLKDYDDLLLIFKYGDSWYASIWQIAENELNLVDFRASGEADSLVNVLSLVKEFHKKFYNFQQPSKGVVMLPDNNSYKVTSQKDDDCGDMCMAFLYLYSIGSLLIEIKLTPPKRANFSIAFGWLLLKIYHEEEYNFHRNIMTPTPKRTELIIKSLVNTPEMDESGQDNDDDQGHAFDFADILQGGVSQLPRSSHFKEHIRYTPMPKKGENVAPSEEEDNRDTENEDFRKRVVNVATPSKKPPSAFKPLTKQNILDSEDLNSFEFEKSNHSDDAHLRKPNFNQQERRTANSKMNLEDFYSQQQNDWDNLQDDNDLGFKKKLNVGNKVNTQQQLNTKGSSTTKIINLASSLNNLPQNQTNDPKDRNYFQNVGSKVLNSDSQILQTSLQLDERPKKYTKSSNNMSNEELVRLRASLAAEMQQIKGEYIKRTDIADILQEIQREVGFEMKVQMRKLADDVKFEREKKSVEEELKKSHFNQHFQFLLDYYKQYDIAQYYSLLSEYNSRIRGMTLSNLPQLQPPQIGSASNSTALPISMNQAPPGYLLGSSSPQFTQNQSHFQVLNRPENTPGDELLEGFFNRGTMKYATSQTTNNNRYSKNHYIPNEKDAPSIDDKYLKFDNNFKNNMKVPKNGQFSSPGVNGFAIQPEKALLYKERTNKYLQDSQALGQQIFDQRILQMEEKKKADKIMKSMEKFSGGTSSVKIFGKDGGETMETVLSKLDQAKKYTQLQKDSKNRQYYRPVIAPLPVEQLPKDEEYGSDLRMLVPMTGITESMKTKKTTILSDRADRL